MQSCPPYERIVRTTSLRSDLASLGSGVTLNERLQFKIDPPWPKNPANTVSDDPQHFIFRLPIFFDLFRPNKKARKLTMFGLFMFFTNLNK